MSMIINQSTMSGQGVLDAARLAQPGIPQPAGANAPAEPAATAASSAPAGASATSAGTSASASGDTVSFSAPRNADDAAALLDQVRGLLSSGPDEGLGHHFDPDRIAKLLG